MYGAQSIKKITAKAGDLIVANTTGFHRGTKPDNRERIMLTLNYVIHQERNLDKKFKTKKAWVDSLSDHKKCMFDFMELI